MLLGDNIYSDDPTRPDQQMYYYYQRQSRPEYRQLLRQTPVYTVWDDHDFATNDSWGPEIERPIWKRKTKGDSLDTWNGFQTEREEIFGFIKENRLSSVILMSANRHRSDAWWIERPN